MAIVTLGIDLAKNVFALHGVDATGMAVLVRPSAAFRCGKRPKRRITWRWRWAKSSMPAMAWLLFVLKKVEDDPTIFPRGKWATLQHIESQLDVVAERLACSLTAQEVAP